MARCGAAGAIVSLPVMMLKLANILGFSSPSGFSTSARTDSRWVFGSIEGATDRGDAVRLERRLVGEDYVCCLLRDHVDSAGDKETGDTREHRGVHDPQPIRAVDAEIRGDDAVLSKRADRAGAAGMMAPGTVAHELGQLRIR